MIGPFRHFIMPDRERMRIAVLSPAWEMNHNGSLARYLTRAVEQCGSEGSGFFFHEDGLDFAGVEKFLDQSVADGEPVMLMGASSAYLYLLDYLAERGKTYALAKDSRVFDTGGFKSTKTDMTVDDLYAKFLEVFGVARTHCVNMYGMTELSSQIYDQNLLSYYTDGSSNYLKATPSWVRSVFLDPATLTPVGDRALRFGELEFLSGDSDRRSWRAHRFRLRAQRSCEGCGGTRLLHRRRRGDGGKRMSVIDIFHAPRGFVFEDFETRGVLTDRGEVTLRYPVLTPETVQDLCETTRCNRSQTLAAYSVEHIVDIIGEAVELWTNPDYEGRQIAESLIPSITGYDATMTRIELKRYMRMFRRRELLRFLDDELPSPRMLDEYRPNKSGGYTRLYGPDLTFHVFSSNVPGIPVWSMTMSLLTKSAIIGKSSFDEPLMPVLFARSLTQINPDLADVLAIVPWRGGTVELEDVAIGEANAVIAYGSSHTTEAIRPRVSAGKPFLSYGARIGFSLIGREALRADTHVQTVHRMAVDVATYDQQSCLAPQTIFVERGGAISPAQTAELLASELDSQQRKYPRSTPSDTESLAIRRARSQTEMQALFMTSMTPDSAAQADPQAPFVIESPQGTDWTVLYYPNTSSLPSLGTASAPSEK